MELLHSIGRHGPHGHGSLQVAQLFASSPLSGWEALLATCGVWTVGWFVVVPSINLLLSNNVICVVNSKNFN